MAGVYSITEFGSFIAGAERPGYSALPKRTFEQLEDWILSNRGGETGALEFMRLGAKKGVGKTITARNYVGVITLRDGATIEILPKLCAPRQRAESEEKERARARLLLLEMLKTLRSAPYRSFQTAHVDVERMDLFEIFIRMFLDEVFRIVKRGLKSDYEAVEGNETVWKGKLKVAQHIRQNAVHKEWVYVQYDDYTQNRPENRLLKSALCYVFRRSHSARNRRDSKTLLRVFAAVEPSRDYEGDYARCVPQRGMEDYTTALLWCRVFLTGKSFTAFSGAETAAALLFPMEELFESYIAAQFRGLLKREEFAVSAQDRSHALFDVPDRKFLLRPDLVITRKRDGTVFLLDTKWKMLSGTKPNYGIAQSDMYQMVAYQKKYGAEHSTLLYPLTEGFPGGKLEYSAEDGANVRVRPVDLSHAKESLAALAEEFRG